MEENKRVEEVKENKEVEFEDVEFTTTGFETSKEVDKIFPALVNFHKGVETIKMTGINPFFSSKYASLADILSNINPVLAENDLFVMQIPTNKGNDEMLVHTRIMHSSGQYVKADTVSVRKVKDPQQIIAFSTYMRRAAISALLSLCFDTDDDGNSISPENTAKAQQVQSETPTTPTRRRRV